MKMLGQIEALRRAVLGLRADGRVAFVPTMGNLHAGHLTLVREAFRHADSVVVSIFVNPLQFEPNEDLDKYPRTLEADCRALEAEGVDLLFVPPVEVMYPVPLEQQTRVEVPGISTLYCGASRPGHFAGVATVVCKLFNMVQPELAIFGKKDYQQLLVMRRMVRDLAMSVEILGVDTVREPDGLAMSSRNRYLDASERRVAPRLYATLRAAAARVTEGECNWGGLGDWIRKELDNVGFRTDYAVVVDAATLLPPADRSEKLVILVAAWLGKARLIDNLEMEIK